MTVKGLVTQGGLKEQEPGGQEWEPGERKRMPKNTSYHFFTNDAFG